jgi:hypothetical protein
MKSNLRTVSFDNDNKLNIFNGWTVSTSSDAVFVHLLGSMPRENADVSIREKNPDILHSASVLTFTEEIIKEEYFPFEDSMYDSQSILVTFHKIEPKADNNFYYRFLLGERKDISFSSTFDVLIDNWIEDPYYSERYSRMVYACLPYEAPLILDTRSTICVSPF